MSSRLVKAMPSLVFTAVTEENCTASTGAICLEDYRIGDKIRISPCHHSCYSYLFAKCLQQYGETYVKRIPSLEIKTALRIKFLQHGGAVEPVELLNDSVGDSSIRYSKGGVIPDIRALSEEIKLI